MFVQWSVQGETLVFIQLPKEQDGTQQMNINITNSALVGGSTEISWNQLKPAVLLQEHGRTVTVLFPQ